MKKNWICLLGLIISLSLIVLINAEVRINEVMAKTPSSIYGDSDCEWIEIYSTSSENLANWILNTPGHNLTLNVSINDFLIITGDDTCFKNNWADVDESKIIKWSAISLNDDKDSVFLFNNNLELINNFVYNSSTSEKSWQFCSNSWLERSLTPATKNNCSTIQNNPPQNNTNNTNIPNQETSISLEIDWNEDDIVNGEEFDIEVNAKNLKDKKYDIMIWIENNGKVISDRYGEDSNGKDVWISGSRYVYNFFNGPGDKTESIKLNISEDYSDFSGDAEIYFKIRDGKEISENIEILEKEDTKDTSNTKKEENKVNASKEAGVSAKLTPSISTSSVTGNVIKLGNSKSIEGTETIENKNGSVIYESKNGKIKLYALLGFSLVCLTLVILLVFNKIK